MFGHTHFIDYILEEGKHVYVNIGSWQDAVFVDYRGLILNTQKYCPYIEVSTSNPGGVPDIVHKNAEDGEEINIKEVYKDYEDSGLFFS